MSILRLNVLQFVVNCVLSRMTFLIFIFVGAFCQSIAESLQHNRCTLDPNKRFNLM